MSQIMYDWGAQMGLRTEKDTVENQFAFGRKELSLVYGIQIDGAARDAGSTPTTLLRPGLCMGQITGTKFFKQYDPTATDGTQVFAGILASPGMRMVDVDGNNQAKSCVMVIAGPIVASKLFGLDNQARAQSYGRFIFDDNFAGNAFGWSQVVSKVANYTVLAADNGTRFVVGNAASGAVTFTLPAVITRGTRFQFYNEANQNMIVAAAAGTICSFNNYAATSVTFSTSGNKIGAAAEVFANEDASRWIVLPIGTATPTVA